MTDSQKFAIIAFNLTIITYQLIFNSGLFGFTFSVLKLLLGLVLAGGVAAGAYFATNRP
jgi:hypothetical protein